MKPEYRWAVVLILVLSGLTYVVRSSSNKHIHTQGELITRSEYYDLYEKRKDSFVDDLRLELDVVNVERQDFPAVRVRLTFINLSSQPLVLRKPDWVGFEIASGCPMDGQAHLYQETGEELKTIIYMADCFGGLVSDSIDDFVELAPRETYSNTYQFGIPLMFDGNDSFEDVPAGNYKLGIDYSNYWAGYEMPWELQPAIPDSLDFKDVESWLMSQKVEYDLNAWVGVVSSNRASFVIPEPAP